MSFRDRMKKKRGGRRLQDRHNTGTKTTGGRFPTIFNKEAIPEGREFWKCKEGQHLADIIPFEAGPDMPFGNDDHPITDEGELDYVLDLFVHVNVGNMNKPYVCPYENFGLPCPICEFIKANRLEKADWQILSAKHRVVYLMWIHDSREDEKKGIQIFEASHYFMEEKIEEIAKLPRGGGYENFSHPDKGKTLAWTRKGSGKENTQYLGHRFIERDVPIPDRILDQSFSLDSIVNMHPSYEEIEKDFKGTLAKKEMKHLNFGDEEDETPFDHSTGDDVPDDWNNKEEEPKKRKRPTSRKRKEAPDEDKPRRPKRKRPSSAGEKTTKRTVKRRRKR